MHSPRRFTRSAAGKSRRLDIAAAAIATALALAACRSSEPGSGGKPSETRASGLAAVPANATAILAALRARPGSPVQAGVAQGFDAVAGGLRPQFAASATAAEPALARVTLPQLGTGAVHLEDAQTGTAVDVSLRGALAAAAQSSDGYVVYPSALASGATVLERALPSGTEDFVNFDTRPATPAIAYDVALGAGVSGLRLVAGTLEMLDAGGAPRLRVSPPYVVGADGARTEAVLAVAGCAFDTSPAAPWGRPVTAPGAKTCTVNVTWPDQAVVYPAVLDPRWTTTGSMATAREDHTATLVSTGKVLVTGGRSSNTGTTGLATAELYDKTSGTWGAAASMSAGRFLHRATQLNTGSNPTTSGKVLISGGINGTTSLSTFQLYDPTAGTWGTAGNLNAPRHGHVATVLADGKVLVSGGLNGTTTLATAAIYNPASGSGSWAATTGPLPPSGQKNHTGVLLVTSNQQLNNKVLLVGGNSGSATLSAVYLFDPAQSAFSTLASIPTPREQHTMTVLADGKVLVTGGKNGSTVLNTAVVFDPGFGPGSWSSAGTMTAARFGHTATLLPASIVANGQVLVAGGSNGTSTLATAELFSGTSTWTTTPAMPAPAQGHTATMLGNNMVLVAGGLNGTTVLNAARLYDASFGLGCTSNSQCPTGFCANGVCCDTACTGTCGACNLATTLGTCSPLANGTVCRAAASGGCDVAETCNGTALTCPTDGFKSSTTSCRAAAGDCDLVENCTGSSATCPADVKKGNGTACNDGNACTQTDTCQAGACTGSNPITCVAQDQCHTAGTCTPATGCSNPAKANGVACNDGNACTQTDTCQSGSCTGANPVVCTAQDQCHVAGTCASGTGICSNPSKANGTTCNDGNLCTQTDTCQSGTCTGGSPVVCTAQDQCHVAGTCASGTGICSNPSKANGTTCNDGNLCTQTDTCQSGSCTGGNPVVCTAQDQCHVAGTCASGTGICSNPSKANGTTCNDGNLCTQTDTCQSGSCTGANPVVCTAQDQCHVVGSCASGTGICSNPSKADGSSCSDGNSCTSGDTCLAGSCNPGSQSCTSIVIAETRGSDNLTPQMTITLGANVTTAVPGDPVEMTAVVTNTGAIVDFFQGHFTIHNTGSTTFVVAGYQQTLERFSVSQQAWVPFAKLAVDAAGNPIPDPDIFALHWDFANSVPATGVTYSANVVGTSIAPDATADWVYRLWPTLPGDIIAKMFDPAQTSGLRMALHFDVPSGPPPAPAIADLADAFPGVTGAIEDPAVLVRFDGLGLVDPVGSLLMPSIPGPIAPGVARTFFGVVAALAMPARDPNGSDPSLGGGTDGQYLGMLAGHILSGYDPGAFVSGHALLTSPGDTFIRTHVAIQLPVVTPQKSGPSQSNAGLTLPYAVALPNSGNAVAGPFSLTDSVDGAAIPGATVTTPPTVAGGQSGIATVAAPTPLTRPAGAMTDVVAVSWHDKNGNVYGPVASSFTTTLGAGHPEGYLSLGGETTYPDLLNTPKTLTAKALDPYGNPVAGVTVNFAVSGVNAQTANPVTDAAGNATFAYAGTHLGNDTIVASATITTTVVSATVHAQWASSVVTPCTGRATPRDVMFVIDGSPSMFDPSNVNAAKAASDTLIDDLDFSRDQVAAVLFSGAANLEVPLTANAASAKAGIDASLEAYAHACDGFCAGGSNYAQALNIALAELQGPRHRATASPLVIFLSDGGNTGVDPTPQITQLHDLGIRTLSVGLGPDVVVSMMRKIASSANDYFYAPTTSGLAWVYGNLEEDACRTNPPLVSAGGDQGLYDVRLPDILTLQGEAHGSGPQGDKRLTSEWTQVSGPAPVSFTDASSPVTQVLFTAPGTYVFQLAASDGFLTVADRATITVDPDPSIVGASLVIALGSPGPLTTGALETVTATLTDGQGAAIRNFVIRFTVAGANAATATVVTNTAGVAVFAYQGMKPGTDAVHATAFGTTLQLDSATVSVNWTQPTTGGPILTQGWIASPAHQATVMGQIPVVLSPTVTLTGGTLTYWPTSAPGQVHILNPSTTGAPGATLGTLDTTMLANGTYILKLDGTDNAGDQKVSEVAVIVSGDYKPGRLLVEVTDFTIPLAGLPITVGRRYDSLEKDNEGDFGHGWSLIIGHPKLEVDPGHNVTMTLPNGRRDTFYFGGTSFPFPFSYLFAPQFFPAPGVFGKLTSDGCEITIVNGGQLLCFEQSTLDFAPTTYTYTDPYGRELVMAASGELKSIKDLQGNTLSFEPNGIVSSAGKTVTFEREQGRITKVTSPAVGGTPIEWHYGYDVATGDLTTVNLPPADNSAVVQYTYDQHRLLKTIDPNNHPARTSTYYPDGRLHTDKDAMLNLTSYEYDLLTRTTRTTNPDTGVVTQVFDDRGLLLTETDPLGHTTTHTYDGDRNEKTRTDALNETMYFGYDTQGNQTSTRNARNETTAATYNDFGQLTTFTDQLQKVTTIEYDDRGLPTSFSDELGTRFTFTSSEQGLPLTIDDAAGHRAYLDYDGAGNLTSRTDWLSHVTKSTYDEIGRRVTETSARGDVRTNHYNPRGTLDNSIELENGESGRHRFEYDANDNILHDFILPFTPFPGRSTIYTYDDLNRVKHVTYGDSHTKDYTYDFRGNKLTEIDEAGHLTKYTYDFTGRLKTTTFPGTTPTEHPFTFREYDELLRLKTLTDELGHTTTYEYEVGCGCSDRLTKVTDPLLHATITTYDAKGRRDSVTDPAGHRTEFLYDVRDHLTDTNYFDGTNLHDEYDPRGRRLSSRDQTAKTTFYGYDDQGQLTSVTDPLQHVTSYTYDPDGNLATVTDANNHITSYEYDLHRRKTKRTLPLEGFERFGYDPVGNQTSHTDFRGNTTKMDYDARDRLLHKIPDPTLGEPTVTYTYHPTGVRESMTDASGTTTYPFYDPRDRLLTKATSAGTLTYTYDLAGNLKTIQSSNPNGTFVEYGWDEANQLTSVKDHSVLFNGSPTETTATYSPTGRPSTLSQPNGVAAAYAYNHPVDRLTSMAWQRGSNPAFASWVYTYNDRGQRLTATDVTGRSAAYGYDNVARLLSETITNDPRGAVGNGALTYVLDAAGNRLSRASTLAGLAAQTLTYDANDQLTSDSYDPNGNTTSSDGSTYAYDFENRLVSKNGGAVTIVYDGDGNRVAKTGGGVTTKYLVDDLNPTGYLQVLEEVSAGVVQTRYTFGSSLVSQTRNASSTPTTSYYGYDAHGNITFLADTSGVVTDTYVYDAWGNMVGSTGSTPNTRLYLGEEVDPDLGLINLRARQHRAGTGRFLTLDPINGRLSVPVSFNRYLYGAGDPVNRQDPLGLLAATEEGIIFAGVPARVFVPLASAGAGSGAAAAAGGATAAVGVGALGPVGITGQKTSCNFQKGADVFAAMAGEEVVREDPSCPVWTCLCEAEVFGPLSDVVRKGVPQSVDASGIGDNQETAEIRCCENLEHKLLWHPANPGSLELGDDCEIIRCYPQ